MSAHVPPPAPGAVPEQPQAGGAAAPASPSGLSGLLDPDHAALLARRVSVNVATRDAALTPHLMRAIGYRASDDGRALTVLLSAAQADSLLADIADNHAVAVVISEPTTHQTLQLKGLDARETPVLPDDADRSREYRERLADELGEIGFPRDMVRAFLHCPGERLVAVTFTPALAFRQTPGARAGERLGSQS